MPPSTSLVAAFKQDLLTDGIDAVLKKWLFDGNVVAFSKHPKARSVLEARVRQTLGDLPELELAVVGSAKGEPRNNLYRIRLKRTLAVDGNAADCGRTPLGEGADDTE
ncbi:MAG: hypothetical protein HY048_10650 [Acidobacteria bacterium]|nr:hypothetical protein [Acidobacteriota bacterium]